MPDQTDQETASKVLLFLDQKHRLERLLALKEPPGNPLLGWMSEERFSLEQRQAAEKLQVIDRLLAELGWQDASPEKQGKKRGGRPDPNVAHRRTVLRNLVAGRHDKPTTEEICQFFDQNKVRLPEPHRDVYRTWYAALQNATSQITKIVSADLRRSGSR